MIEKSIPLVIILGLLLCYFFAPKIFWWVVRGLVTGFDQMVTRLANSAFLRFFCGQKKTRSQKDTDEWTANLLHHLEKQKAGSEGGNETREPAKSTEPLTPTEPPTTPPSEPETPAKDGGNGSVVDQPESVKLKQNRLDTLVIRVNVLAFLLALLMISFGAWRGSNPLSFSDLSKINTVSAGMSLLLIQIIYMTLAVDSVRLNEQAIILAFGAFVRFGRKGLNIVPPFFCEIIKATTAVIEKDVPDEPGKIWHGDATKGDGKVPDGLTPAVRVAFAPAPPTNSTDVMMDDGRVVSIPSDDPYRERNMAEIEGSYGWRITNLRTFVEKFGNKNPVAKAQKQLDDCAVAVLTHELPSITAAEAMMRMEYMSSRVTGELKQISQGWGVEIDFFRLKPFIFSHELGISVREASEAVAKKTTKIRESEAEREALTNTGIGKANAHREFLNATADGQAKTAKVASTPAGQFAMAVNAIQTGLETARAVIVPEGNIFGAIAGATEMMRQFPITTPDGTTDTPESAEAKPEPKPVTEKTPHIPTPRKSGGRKKSRR